MIIFIVFLTLAFFSFWLPRPRAAALARTREDWIIDCAGLLAQGAAVPLLVLLLYSCLCVALPRLRGIVPLGFLPGFLLNFVLVDYLYYWNHRWLHGPRLWRMHAVHHSAERFDVFITSRNTLWTSFLILYFWVNAIGMFLLREPAGFIFGASLSAALDLWRHTAFSPKSARWLGWLLILPRHHAWHHSRDRGDWNFGANFSLWDRLHGTYFDPREALAEFGIPMELSVMRKLFFPFREAFGVRRMVAAFRSVF